MKNFLEKLEKETALIAYIDLANMLYWRKVLGWKFNIEDLAIQLQAIRSVKEIKVYYGFDGRNYQKSKRFHERIRATGAILRSKPVKYIKKSVNEALVFKQSTATLFHGEIISKITSLVEGIKQSGIIIEEPKCNFDVELSMDLLDDADKISGIMFFCGDSDLKAPLERLKVMGKTIYLVGVRGMTAAELHAVKDYYVDFGKFYSGRKYYQ